MASLILGIKSNETATKARYFKTLFVSFSFHIRNIYANEACANIQLTANSNKANALASPGLLMSRVRSLLAC